MIVQKMQIVIAAVVALALAAAGSEPPMNRNTSELDAAKREAADKAAREAGIEADRKKETPTYPTPAKASAIKVDFEDISITIQPSGLSNSMPETIRVRGDGVCGYRIEERPARGTEPKWDAAYLEHELPLERLRRLEALLKKTDWLTARGYEGRADQMHANKYKLTLKRKGETRTIMIDGEKAEPYKSLVTFFHGIALQENLLYRLERLPGREQQDACRQIDQFVRAENGEKYGKPPYEVDLHRYVPTFERYVRNSHRSSVEELAPAARLLGHVRSEPDREFIAALANDRDLNVRTAVAEALGRMGGKESLPVLRRMVRSTDEAAWQLVRLGPAAVPTIVEIIDGGTDPSNERNPEFIDYQKMIRAYLDHWDAVAKPIDPRVLTAVRASMARPKVNGYGTAYHKQLLELAAQPTPPR